MTVRRIRIRIRKGSDTWVPLRRGGRPIRIQEGSFTFVPVRRRGRRRPEEAEAYEVWRGDHRVARYGGDLESVRELFRRWEREEREVEAALRTGDPRNVCALGWHRLAARSGGTWFRHVGGKPGKMLVFRVGRAPVQYRCTTIWCYGVDARSWACEHCGQAIPSPGREAI